MKPVSKLCYNLVRRPSPPIFFVFQMSSLIFFSAQAQQPQVFAGAQSGFFSQTPQMLNLAGSSLASLPSAVAGSGAGSGAD